MKKRNPMVYAGVFLATLLLFLAANWIKVTFFGEKENGEEEQIKGEYALKALYLEDEEGNSIFINLTDEYPFSGTIPEGGLFDEAGEEMEEEDLNSGDVVNIWGNGVIAESYPAQYHGISKIQRTVQKNQEYLEKFSHYLSELFVPKDPAERPHLNVCYTDRLGAVAVIIPEPLSYTWSYEEENGETKTMTTDAPHILQAENLTEVNKLSQPMDMELQFNESPQQVKILVWEDSLAGAFGQNTGDIPEGREISVQETDSGNFQFTAEPGYVYLVTGTWEAGTADYGFATPATAE